MGDEGLGLQQVLKHDIESVTIFQPDEELVGIIKAHVLSVYDCSKIEGIADDCLADDLVNWIKEAGKSLQIPFCLKPIDYLNKLSSHTQGQTLIGLQSTMVKIQRVMQRLMSCWGMPIHPNGQRHCLVWSAT